jgi:hypothetical protein
MGKFGIRTTKRLRFVMLGICGKNGEMSTVFRYIITITNIIISIKYCLVFYKIPRVNFSYIS